MDSFVDVLEATPNAVSDDEHLCGTSACLAGHAVFLWDKSCRDYMREAARGEDHGRGWSFDRKGLGVLGLPPRLSCLFYRSRWPHKHQEGTLLDAVAVLKGILSGDIGLTAGDDLRYREDS